MPQLKKCHGCDSRYEKGPSDDSFKCWCSPECGRIVARARQEKSRLKAEAKRKSDSNKLKKKIGKEECQADMSCNHI